MKISVIVKPNSKMESITQAEDGSLIVKVRAPPVDGKANERLIEILAAYFKKPKSSVKLIRGNTGKKKVFEII